MGERVGAGIRFGGTISRENAEELIELIESFDLKAGWCEKPTIDNLGEFFADGQVNYGDLADLENFAEACGLDYEYWCDSGSEWQQQTRRRVDGVTDELVGCQGEFSIAVSEIKRDGLGKTMQRIMWFEEPLKPLEVVS